MAKKNADIEKYCIFCEHAVPLVNQDFVLCQKKGVVSSLHKCRKFEYDPLKRKPASHIAPKLEFINIDQ